MAGHGLYTQFTRPFPIFAEVGRACETIYKYADVASITEDFRFQLNWEFSGGGMRFVASLASHTLRRAEERSGHAATIKLSPRQKLDVTNQIRALRRSHLLSWSNNYVTTCLADVSILLSNCCV